MVNLLEKTISIKGRTYPLTSMEVWFYIEGHGLVTSIEELKSFEELRFSPVAVAISASDGKLDIYEIVQ